MLLGTHTTGTLSLGLFLPGTLGSHTCIPGDSIALWEVGRPLIHSQCWLREAGWQVSRRMVPRGGGAAGVLKSRCRGVNLANSPPLLTPQSPTRQAPCPLVSLAVGGRPKTQARNWQGESDVEANAGSSLSLASTIGSDEPFPAEAALLLAASGWGIVCNPTGKVGAEDARHQRPHPTGPSLATSQPPATCFPVPAAPHT